MKFYLFTILLFFVFIPICSQTQGYIYSSYTDVLSEEVSETLLNLYVEKQNAKQTAWSGKEYKIFTGEKKTDKKIKKEVAAIMANDTLFLNLYKLKCKKNFFGARYAYAFSAESSIFFYTYPPLGDKTGMTGGGVIGGIIEAYDFVKRTVYYELSPETKLVTLVTAERIQELLINHPEELNQFEEETGEKDWEMIYKYVELWREKL